MPLTLSYGGSGFFFPFMLGVSCGLRQYFDINWDQAHVHCISSGSAGALALLLYSPQEIDNLMEKAIQLMEQLPRQDYQIQLLNALLPPDTYRRVSSRLTVGTSRLPLLLPKLHHRIYQSQEELFTDLQASARIPLITEGFQRELDGGFSHPYAIHDENTIVVTLKKHPHSDVFARSSLFFTELFVPSPDEMWHLYDLGQQVVIENYDVLSMKIRRGLQSPGHPIFQPYF